MFLLHPALSFKKSRADITSHLISGPLLCMSICDSLDDGQKIITRSRQINIVNIKH